jgi:hypothetical protein
LPEYSSIPIGRILRLERRGCRFESGLLYMGTYSFIFFERKMMNDSCPFSWKLLGESLKNWFVAQWKMHRAFNPGVVSSSLTGPTKKRTNSSTAERWFVRPMVESSNLSSSSMIGRIGRAVMQWLAKSYIGNDAKVRILHPPRMLLRSTTSFERGGRPQREQLVLWQNGLYAPG